MGDPASIVQSVLSGILTGGASAATTFLAVFKDIKKRISELEQKVGDPNADPKLGLYGAVEALTEQVKRLRREIDQWRDDPPEWLTRWVNKTQRGSINLEQVHEIEERLNERIRTLSQSLKRLEDDLDRREQRLEDEIERSSPEMRAIILRDEYEADSRKRAQEIEKIKANLATANGFLRGVMAALGYLEDPPVPPPPPSLPLPPKKKVT